MKKWNEIDLKVHQELTSQILQLTLTIEIIKRCALAIESKYEFSEQEQEKNSGRY